MGRWQILSGVSKSGARCAANLKKKLNYRIIIIATCYVFPGLHYTVSFVIPVFNILSAFHAFPVGRVTLVNFCYKCFGPHFLCIGPFLDKSKCFDQQKLSFGHFAWSYYTLKEAHVITDDETKVCFAYFWIMLKL